MMLVANLAVARLVPLLLLLSVVLVAGRVAYDRYRVRHEALARVVFGGILTVGVLAVTPYCLASSSLVRAELAVSLGAWARASSHFDTYARLAGRPADHLARDWVVSLMNLHEWDRAEVLLQEGVKAAGGEAITTPDTVYLLGICRYYQGRYDYAERTLRALKEGPGFPLREYLLGKLGEARGDATLAEGHYRRALELEPALFAARYHLVRLLAADGRMEEALTTLQQVPEGTDRHAHNPLFEALREALAGRSPVPSPVEFALVQLPG
jgi:tetratricopeptide (TPR) repeat protein